MSWLGDRLNEGTTRAGLVGLANTWGAVLASYVGGTSFLPAGQNMSTVCAAAILASIPFSTMVLYPEGHTQNPPPGGPLK